MDQEIGFYDRIRTGELMNRLSEVGSLNCMHLSSAAIAIVVTSVTARVLATESLSQSMTLLAIDIYVNA